MDDFHIWKNLFRSCCSKHFTISLHFKSSSQVSIFDSTTAAPQITWRHTRWTRMALLPSAGHFLVHTHSSFPYRQLFMYRLKLTYKGAFLLLEVFKCLVLFSRLCGVFFVFESRLRLDFWYFNKRICATPCVVLYKVRDVQYGSEPCYDERYTHIKKKKRKYPPSHSYITWMGGTAEI